MSKTTQQQQNASLDLILPIRSRANDYILVKDWEYTFSVKLVHWGLKWGQFSFHMALNVTRFGAS